MSENFGIESVLQEDRVFDPPADFQDRVGGAWVDSMEMYRELHQQSIDNSEDFWAAVANELDWFKKWDTVLEWDCPDARWFTGGKINACHNCVDRIIDLGHGDEPAIIWEGEPMLEDGPEIRRLTYRDLKVEVSRFANALKARGVKRGDVVTIYMGMVPELTIAVLACARIGAPHSVIFGGFSPQSIADRVEDADSKIIITCDGSWRRGKIVPLKSNVDQALTMTDRVSDVVVLRRCQNDIEMQVGRDHWWHEVVEDVSDECPCEEMDSEDMLFLLYTSGSTGKPKGIVHTTGGYLAYTFLTSRYVFNLRPGNDHVYWCTADVGWITGHSYIIYGILQNHVPTLMYEGAPNSLVSRGCTSRATARGAMIVGTSGLWAAWMMSSTCQATGSARWKWSRLS